MRWNTACESDRKLTDDDHPLTDEQATSGWANGEWHIFWKKECWLLAEWQTPVLLRSDYEMIRRSCPVTVISAYFSYGQWPIDDKLYTLSIPIQHGVFHSSIAIWKTTRGACDWRFIQSIRIHPDPGFGRPRCRSSPLSRCTAWSDICTSPFLRWGDLG